MPDRFSAHYGRLRAMARSRLRQHDTFTLLNTVDLLHECFLRLMGPNSLQFDDQAAFLAYAGRVMRSVIVDIARARLAVKRGQHTDHEEFSEELHALADPSAMQILDVDQAILDLYKQEPRLAQVLELQYFAGMTEKEISTCLGVSDRTVRRDIQRAEMILRVILKS